MTDLELALEIAKEIRAENKRTRLPFTLEPGEPGLTESKVGGTPYLPKGERWPVDGGGKPMTFLAQVDCARLEALPDFPHTGLLQFFIGADDVFGMDFDNMMDPAGFRVLYWERVDPAVTAADIHLPPPSEEWDTPLGEKPCRICFREGKEQDIPDGDHLFEKLFCQEWNRRRPEKPIQTIWDFYHLFSKEGRPYDALELEEGEEEKARHQLDGYPFFTQSDPRGEKPEYSRMDTLLFQLDSDGCGPEDLVLWGDCGVGGFFINREDLRRRDFSKVLYNWDCC